MDEAVAAGARLSKAAKILGLSVRTVERWRKPGQSSDQRRGPLRRPDHAFSHDERAAVLSLVNSPAYRDLPPSQIVPRLADELVFIASESSIYRILRQEKQLKHRSRARPRRARKAPALEAVGPNQVWSWDISYLKSNVTGLYYYLYLMMDIYSRKIVGWQVCDREDSHLAAELLKRICAEQHIDPQAITLHSDNGSPMKGKTMLETIRWLGISPSFSRPSVSNDNPFSEALFRTLKYCPKYPLRFSSLEEAHQWMAQFVQWYNHVHLHSGIRFVTPHDRHTGHDHAVLRQRADVYRKARQRNPKRWSGAARNWTPVGPVYLAPQKNKIRRSAVQAHTPHQHERATTMTIQSSQTAPPSNHHQSGRRKPAASHTEANLSHEVATI